MTSGLKRFRDAQETDQAIEIERFEMSLTVNLYYKGENGAARKFAEEMESSGIADAIRAEAGNERYEYYIPMNDHETILLIDSWRDQRALDAHHASPMMQQLAELREKYDLHMRGVARRMAAMLA